MTPPRAPFWRPSVKPAAASAELRSMTQRTPSFCPNLHRKGRGMERHPGARGGHRRPDGQHPVSGSVALAGGGEVTSCKFEFGETTAYGQEEPCSPAAPFNSDQALVTAELKDDLEGEHTYHYRLVASNANGAGRGVDKTITPHNVKGLATGPATAITSNSVTLTGTFEGNGEDTHYWFEWGRTPPTATRPRCHPARTQAHRPGRQKSRPT